MLCATKTDPSSKVEPQSALCPAPAHGHELTARESRFAGDRRRASRFIADSSHTIPEHVWGDEGPTAV